MAGSFGLVVCPSVCFLPPTASSRPRWDFTASQNRVGGGLVLRPRWALSGSSGFLPLNGADFPSVRAFFPSIPSGCPPEPVRETGVPPCPEHPCLSGLRSVCLPEPAEPGGSGPRGTGSGCSRPWSSPQTRFLPSASAQPLPGGGRHAALLSPPCTACAEWDPPGLMDPIPVHLSETLACEWVWLLTKDLSLVNEVMLESAARGVSQ